MYIISTFTLIENWGKRVNCSFRELELDRKHSCGGSLLTNSRSGLPGSYYSFLGYFVNVMHRQTLMQVLIHVEQKVNLKKDYLINHGLDHFFLCDLKNEDYNNSTLPIFLKAI